MMPSDLAFFLVAAVVLMLLVVVSRWLWRVGKAAAATKPPRAKRDPKPFVGFTRQPECPACEQAVGRQPSTSEPHAPPPRITFTRGRRRDIDTTGHCCPQ